MGSIILKASGSEMVMKRILETTAAGQENTLENDLLLVRVDEEGMSIYDKEFSRGFQRKGCTDDLQGYLNLLG